MSCQLDKTQSTDSWMKVKIKIKESDATQGFGDYFLGFNDPLLASVSPCRYLGSGSQRPAKMAPQQQRSNTDSRDEQTEGANGAR